ncbi:MAG: hypothetical protein P8Q99_07920 [Paracoccaceae bacterium]|nr:hypothetical protein [Paracoccaceae bacterium]
MLYKVLKTNAASCLLFGVLFLIAPVVVANALGNPPVLLLQILGLGLIGNGLLILWAASKPVPNRAAVLFFVFGDAIWVVATLILILTGLWITTALGILLSIAVAIFVGGCGFLQWRLLPS